MYDILHTYLGDGTNKLWELIRLYQIDKIITNHITDNISYSQWIMFGRYSPSRELIHYDIWNYNSSHYGDITNSNAWWFYFYYARRDFKNIPSDENMYDLKRMYGSGTNKLWALTDQGHIYGAGYIDKDYTRQMRL